MKIRGCSFEGSGVGVRRLDSPNCSIGGHEQEVQNLFGRCALGVGVFGDDSSECRVERNLFSETEPNIYDVYAEGDDHQITDNVHNGRRAAIWLEERNNTAVSSNDCPAPENGDTGGGRTALVPNNCVGTTVTGNNFVGTIVADGGDGNEWFSNAFDSVPGENSHEPPIQGGAPEPTIEITSADGEQVTVSGNIAGAVAGQTFNIKLLTQVVVDQPV